MKLKGLSSPVQDSPVFDILDEDMPTKNSLKQYIADGYYHVYNRGVNKMSIFRDKQDYGVFLSYVKNYLTVKDTERLNTILRNSDSTVRQKNDALKQLKINNFHNRITLIAYCLMPNHFHILVKQKNERDLELFMRSFMTRYTQYFNRRYKRIGPVYQSRYQAVLVETDEQLIHLTRYIHRNPFNLAITANKTSDRLLLQPSSYAVYLKKIRQEWINPDIVLQRFSKIGFNSYQSFVESQDVEEQSMFAVARIALDFSQ